MISKQQKLEILSAVADYLSVDKGFSENTVISYCRDLKIFFAYLEKIDGDLINFTEDNVRDFMKVRTQMGICALSIRRSLASIMALIRYYHAEEMRSDDPIANIERPKRSRNLPKVMSEQTVEMFLNAPDIETFIGLRDRAMLELLYSCGLRVTELCNLKFADLHLSESYIIIRGKGETERMIPMTKICASWIEAYIKKGRMLKDPHFKCHYVFLSTKTINDVPKPMSRISFWFRIKYYSEQLGIESAPSPHTFRHAFATHLLNHDADLRSLQMLLGHKSLTTTQIYTHVALARMHSSYESAHPRAKAEN